MTREIKVMVLGDLPITRAAVRLLLQSHDHFDVIAEAAVGVTALDLNGNQRPDIVLLDCDPESENALELLPELLKGAEAWQVILLTDSSDRDFQQRAIQLGS